MKYVQVYALVAGAAMAAAGWARGAELPPPVTLEKSGYAYAVQPETGLLAAVETDGDTVRFYPKLSSGRSTDGATALTTPKAPIDIVFKQYGKQAYFVVVCHDATKAVLIDAGTLKAVKEIPLAIKEASSVFASLDPKDRFVYYCGDRGHESRVGVIDLEALKDVGAISAGMGNSAMDGAISADGTVLYSRGPWSPSGFCASSVVPGWPGQAPRVSQLHYDHRSVGPYVPDPFGQMVATGNEIYTRDLKAVVGKTDAPASCFLPHKPLILALQGGDDDFGARRNNGRKLVVASYNTLKTVATVDLPARGASGGAPKLHVESSQADFKRLSFRTQVLADAKNDNVLVCDATSVLVIATRDLGAPAEPFLYAAIDGPRQLSINEAAVLTVKRKDPSVKVELKEAPAGMTLKNDTLAWTPGEDAIGTAKVSLRLSSGQTERSQEIELRVSRGVIALPFVPNIARAAPDGSVAAIGRGPGEADNYAATQPNGAAGSSRIALIDLKTRAVAAERTLMAAVNTVAVDSQYVYAGLRDSDAYYVLARKDLADIKRIFTTGRVAGFTCTGDKLVVQTESGATSVIKVSDLSAVDSPANAAGQANMGYGQRMLVVAPVDMGDAVLVSGIVFDASLEKIKALLSPTGLHEVPLDRAGPRSPFGNRFDQQQPPTTSRWGVYCDYNGLRRSSGQVVAQYQAQGSLILPGQPATVALVLSTPQSRNAVGSKAELVYRDLISGSPMLSTTLYYEPIQQYANDTNRQAVLQLAGENLVAVVRDRMYVTKIPALDPAKFPPTLHVPVDQGVVVLSADKPTAISFAARGGEAPIEYSLGQEFPGVEIDKAKGVLTIAAGAFLDKALANLPGSGPAMAVDPETGMPISAASGDMPSYIKTASARFKTLTGRAPNGVPVAVRVAVTARDKNLQTAVAERIVLLELPTAKVEEKIKERQAAAARKPRGPRGADTQAAPPDIDDADRVDRLEKRIESLESKIDLLTRILGEKREQK